MKKYYITTNAYNGLVIVIDGIAAEFDVENAREAIEMDTSNIDGMTAEELAAEYDTFDFDENDEAFETITPLDACKYVSITCSKDGTGDIFDNYFDTLKEANDDAWSAWYHLTPGEKKKNIVYVGKITLADLTHEAFCTNGAIEWGLYDSINTSPEFFDSEKI